MKARVRKLERMMKPRGAEEEARKKRFNLMRKALGYLTDEERSALDRAILTERRSLNDIPPLLAVWEIAMERARHDET